MTVIEIPNYEHIGKLSNAHFTLSDVSLLLEDKEEIVRIIREFKMYQLPRLELLESYYLSENYHIFKGQRRKNPDKADHRAAHGFASAITGFHVNYLVGVPVRIESDETQVTEYIKVFNEDNDIDAHHLDLATDLSKYGRAYELLHFGEDVELFLSNPYWTVVIYDESIQRKPIAALRFPKVKRKNGMKYAITLYTETEVIEFEPGELVAEDLIEKSRTPHVFDGVPIIEYSHNRYRIGDYERVLTNIDLYDEAQSDTANYMTDLSNAILVVSGDFKSSEIKYEKEIDALLLESGMDGSGKQTYIDAKYVYKQYDVAGTEAYKKRIERDIYKFSNTPDLTTENFSGNQSGESKKYLMVAPEQARTSKERILTKGFNRRYRLLSNSGKFTQDFTADFGKLKYTFTANMPESISDELKMFTDASGKLSNRTLLTLMSFVDDVDAEVKQIQEEDTNWLPSDVDRT